MYARLIAIFLMLGMGNPATADSYEIADQLAMMLASEETCGLSYDPEAIDGFVAENVDAGDMEFAGTLSSLTGIRVFSIQKMSPSALRAHCTQIRRAAEAHNLLR